MHRRLAMMLLVALLVSACGGSATIGTGSPATDASSASLVAVPASLEFLGDLVVPAGGTTIATYLPEGGTVTLDDGTAIAAAPGAFTAPVELTIQRAELDLSGAFETAPFARAYVVSTVDDIALGAPVAIEIPRSAEGLAAVQVIDGEVSVVPVLGDATVARIGIPHFSEVATLVVEAFNAERAELRAAEEQGAADADFLSACAFTLYSLYGGIAAEEVNDSEGSRFAGDIALSVCTTALIRRASPTGVRVSTACVGDRISDTVDLRAAIGLCAAEAEPATAADGSAADVAEAPAEDTPADTPSEPVDPGPSFWSGNLILNEGSVLTPYGDLTVDIDRAPGTDTFTAHVVIGTQSTTDFFQIGECTTVIVKTFDGAGTWDDTIPDAIAIEGTQFVDWQYPDCSGITENDSIRDHVLLVRVTETGIQGGFEGFQFALEGVPRPLGG